MCFMRVRVGTMIGPSRGELAGVPELVPQAGLSPPLCRWIWGQLTTPRHLWREPVPSRRLVLTVGAWGWGGWGRGV